MTETFWIKKSDVEKWKNNDKYAVYTCHRKVTLKSGKIAVYEMYKVMKKSEKGGTKHIYNINEKMMKEYEDILFDDSIPPYQAATKIFIRLTPEDKKQTSIEKIQGFVYRERTKKKNK